MDKATYIGLFGAFAMTLLSAILGGNSLLLYADLPSLVLVIVASYFLMVMSQSLSDGIGIFGIIGRTFKVPTFNETGIIQKMQAFSEKARREGLLALEDELEDLDDEFMKKGLRLMVDGTDAAVIRDLLELELSQMQARHAAKINSINVWNILGPAVGMMGTVIGLIGMLANLEDKASIGPNMALALITTMYGSLVSNYFMVPFATKLRGHDNQESMVKEMIIEGVLSIQAGENTRILAMKLLAYLDPAARKTLEAELLKD
ncbi:MAG: MotA/TolQ/ExbB proton channel family protein [Treponema sp.]|jgi:chemotaxis protein MotA|nr:MotA/TolQ/ExbB proton channel family protein [Treponema sp.]